jgi:hypothetical protein
MIYCLLKKISGVLCQAISGGRVSNHMRITTGMVTKTPGEQKRNLEHAFTTLKEKSIIAGWKFTKDQVLISLS